MKNAEPFVFNQLETVATPTSLDNESLLEKGHMRVGIEIAADCERGSPKPIAAADAEPRSCISELYPGDGYLLRLFAKIVRSGICIYAILPASFTAQLGSEKRRIDCRDLRA